MQKRSLLGHTSCADLPRMLLNDAAAALAAISPGAADGYQPYWVTCAEIALTRGDDRVAAEAMARAIELTTDPATIDHLRGRID